MSYGIAINTNQIMLAGSDDGRMINLDNVMNQKHRFLLKGHVLLISSVVVNSCSIMNSMTAETMVKVHLLGLSNVLEMDDIDWILQCIKDPDLSITVVTDTAVYAFRWNDLLEEVERKATDRTADIVVFYEHTSREQREVFEKAVDNNSDNLAYAIAELEESKLFGTFTVQVVM